MRAVISDIRWTSTNALKVLEFHHPIWGEPTATWAPNGRTCPQHGVTHKRGYQHKLRELRSVLAGARQGTPIARRT